MNTAQPIRDNKKLDNFKIYYQTEEPNLRNLTLIILGLNTALRINDILHITWGDIFDFESKELKTHLEITERKTGKHTRIALNHDAREILSALYNSRKNPEKQTFLFQSRIGENQPLSRYQAFRIIKKAAGYAGYSEHISCHSLRKTFGYYAWKQGIPPAILMNIYNHSSYQITKRYLGIEQDDKDSVFLNVKL